MPHEFRAHGAVTVTMALALAILFAACGGPDADTSTSVTRIDSAGVEIVISEIDDRPLPWSFERLYALGGAEEGPESFYTMSTGFVAADARGRLFVLDLANARVVVFDADGTFVRVLGGRGEGPGEFSSPASLSASVDGEVAVFDFGKAALVRFDSAGGVLPQQPLPFYPWPGSDRHFALSPNGVLVASMLPSAPEGFFDHGLRRVTAADTVLLTDHLFPQPGMVRYASCGGGLNLPRIFEMQVIWDSNQATVVAASEPDYRITIYEHDRAVRQIRTGRAARPATDAMAREQLGEGFRINFGQGLCVIPPAEMVPERGFADALPWVDGVALGPSGRIWVRRFEVGPDVRGEIDVFDATGAYVGTAPADAPFPIVFLDDDTFGAAERDEQGVARLVVYRLARRSETP